MKRLPIFAIRLALVLLFLIALPLEAVNFGNHQVNFMGVRYDYPVAGQSTWYYQVISASTGNAISHVTFGINTCATITGAGKWNGPSGFETLYPGQGSPTPSTFPATPQTDPTTGITGLKFDEGFSAGEKKYYYYTLNGNYAVAPTTMAVKPGGTIITGTIDGPSPTCALVAKIGDYAWVDANVNGVQDAGELPLVGVQAQVYRTSDNTLMGSATSNSNGYWEVTGLAPGTYYVKFLLPTGYSFTSQDQGGNDALDSDANPATGQTGNYTLSSGQFNQTVDVGAYMAASLGNLIWHDHNNDGWVNAGEEGFDGVTVQLLFDADGNGVIEGAETTPIQTKVTAAGGFYSFTGLRPGKYQVVIPASNFASGGELALHSLSSTTTNESPITTGNSVDNDDNGIQSVGGSVTVSPLITLISGENNPTVDFGFLDPAIGNLIWLDLDADGLVDADEPGIADVLLELLDGSGNPVLFNGAPMTTRSNASGFYFFAGLNDGAYRVRIPASNFGSGQPLEELRLSGSPQIALDNQVDDDNNGVQSGAGQPVLSPVITLAAGTEPTDAGSETGRGASMDNTLGDANADMTIDFGFVGMDYGDLPAPYPTLRANNGPRHLMTPTTLRMGALVDAETDGQPSTAANGDDQLKSDDEDGVIMPAQLLLNSQPGISVKVLNTTGQTAILTGWIDTNLNNAFETGERASRLIPNNTDDYVVLDFPNTGDLPALTYARFRLSTQDDNSDGHLEPTGALKDGEVEDYRVELIPPTTSGGGLYDYGDAPTSYGSAGHRDLSNNLQMRPGGGIDVDSEALSYYSAIANGDNIFDDNNDENGVSSFPTLKTTNTTYSVTVAVFNSSGSPAVLVGWIDFNRDGVFTADEGSLVNVPAGANVQNVLVSWSGLSGLTSGPTFARFRLAPSGSGLTAGTPTGIVTGGEAEDYPLNIEDPIAVDLSSFQALVREDGIHLEWTAASLNNVAGYHVLSSDNEIGNYDRLTERMIAVDGKQSRFEYVDRTVHGHGRFYKLEEISLDGDKKFYGPISISSLSDIASSLPTEYRLAQNYPNPFNPQTTVRFSLPQDETVSLAVFDVNGKLVRQLVNARLGAGEHAVVWNGRDERGADVPSGAYLYRLTSDRFTQTRKMVLIR